MANEAFSSQRQHYYVPQPMPWPIIGSASLFLMALGAVFVFNGAAAGWISIALSNSAWLASSSPRNL